MNSFSIEGNIIDIYNKRIFHGIVSVSNNIIQSLTEIGNELSEQQYILPGFIDSHVHIESSMLVPSEFARLAVVHGTVATISDPHEIANVCGVEGVRYMIENGKKVPFKFNFGAPSCVPATSFETAGAAINANDVDELLQSDDILYLSEMMNFPGVLGNDEEVMRKIASAKKYRKPVDGHAPGLRGESAQAYIDAGISTDHECFTEEEALDKLRRGMKILIREGSAARNFDALINLLNEHSDNMMFCSDDKHPDSLVEGHINQLCARAVKKGIDLFKILKAACINPVTHYKMNVGLLKTGNAADFICIKDLENFQVLRTYINGIKVAENGQSLIASTDVSIINQFKCLSKNKEDFKVAFKGEMNVPVIEALDGQLITHALSTQPTISEGNMVANPATDTLKIAVVNRYQEAPVAISFIRNFGISNGAMASSVAHDSHNIVAVGTDEESLCKAVNLIIECSGGISAVCGDESKLLPLPVAGLMSPIDGYEVAKYYTEIDRFTKEKMNSTLKAPFMTLSFMALLVIPHLKLSDKGLFDGDRFMLVS